MLLVEAARRGLVAGKPVQKVKRARVRAVRFPVTDEQRAQIVVLHGRGLNDSQIAAELGLSARTVQRERSVRLGLPPVVVGRPKKVRS